MLYNLSNRRYNYEKFEKRVFFLKINFRFKNLLGRIIILHRLTCFLMSAKESMIFSMIRLIMLPSFIAKLVKEEQARLFVAIYFIVEEHRRHRKLDSTILWNALRKRNQELHSHLKLDISITSMISLKIQITPLS